MNDNFKEAQTQGNANSSPKKKNFLVVYSIALFVFAGALIGLSYLSQARVAADTDKIKQELEVLSQNTEVSADIQARLETVLARNDEIEKENEVLSKENEDLKQNLQTLANADKKALATEYMWQIEKAFAAKNTKECKRLIKEIDGNGLRTYLSANALSELVRIEGKIK